MKIKETLNKFINNPVAIFTAGMILGVIFFILTPTFRNPSEPAGIMGALGYASWGLSVLWIFTAKFFLKKKK